MARAFNRKIFAILIDRARGDRSVKEYAAECSISYVQLHKLLQMAQINPPGKELIRKLSSKSVGDVEYADFMFAAGYDMEEQTDAKGTRHALHPDTLDKLCSLSSGQRRTVEDFIDFLVTYKQGRM